DGEESKREEEKMVPAKVDNIMEIAANLLLWQHFVVVPPVDSRPVVVKKRMSAVFYCAYTKGNDPTLIRRMKKSNAREMQNLNRHNDCNDVASDGVLHAIFVICNRRKTLEKDLSLATSSMLPEIPEYAVLVNYSAFNGFNQSYPFVSDTMLNMDIDQ
ncbi:hypothetical protein Tco_0010292, partial [Tanacetum coccineum]